ncbi:hypothetical protein AAC387_Pa12g1564 [Persea americana]
MGRDGKRQFAEEFVVFLKSCFMGLGWDDPLSWPLEDAENCPQQENMRGQRARVRTRCSWCPKNQDEKMIALHHGKLGSKLTRFKPPARSRGRKKEKTKGEKLPLLVILRQILSVSISFADSPLLLEVAQQHSQITRWESRFEEELMCKQSNPLAGAVTKKLLPIKPKKNHEAKEIMRATNYFASNHVLSSGGNGEVYWGILDGTQVAVKRPYQGAHTVRCRDHIFHELKILGQLHDHYRAGGSTILTWPRCLTIAHQIAECLTYLHNYSVPRIFHVDVKSENILLDDNLNAKLSDFGHSQIIERGQSHISMAAEGTPQLIDPYWRKCGRLTDKTDVYCFGILLVELLTRKTVKILERGDNGVVLVKKQELMDAIGSSLKVGASEVAWKLLMALGSLAVDCLSKHIKDRPPMKQVGD